MNKHLVASVLGLGFAIGAQAATTNFVYLTGSTAFRGVEFSVLQANIANPGLESIGVSSDQQFSFGGTWTGPGLLNGKPIKVYANYSGSVEGQSDLLTGAANTYKKLPSEGAGTFTHSAILSFSDSFQDTTKFGTKFGFPALLTQTVAVQPFVFVKNKQTHLAGINNINDQTFRVLAAAGGAPATYFLGNGDLTTIVYLSGRNNLSGTRTVVFSETGYGVFTGAQQYGNGLISGVYPTTARGADQAGAIAHAPDDGWSSGGNVRADINNAVNTDLFVGYLSAGDARSLIGADGIAGNGDFNTWYLSHNGVAYTKQNVANGLYTLWGYEHLYRTGADATANAFAPGFATAFDTFLTGTFCTDNFPAGIPVSALGSFHRDSEATGITSGPVLP